MYILLTTHGQFARGIHESYKMIAGENKQIHSLILDEDGISIYREKLHTWLKEKEGHEILILSDLRGGTPYNECYTYYLEHADSVRLLSGLNLGMLLEVGLQIEQDITLNEFASLAYTAGKEAICIATNIEEEDELDF